MQENRHIWTGKRNIYVKKIPFSQLNLVVTTTLLY